jgi:hypothetical protein
MPKPTHSHFSDGAPVITLINLAAVFDRQLPEHDPHYESIDTHHTGVPRLAFHQDGPPSDGWFHNTPLPTPVPNDSPTPSDMPVVSTRPFDDPTEDPTPITLFDDEANTHFFRQHVSDGSIKVVKVDTKDQLADIFTKGLTRQVFEPLRLKLLGW